jgi:hypothetical protein
MLYHLALAAAFVAVADSHGAMTMPKPRNTVDGDGAAWWLVSNLRM